jgi:hypothetical protein
MSLSYLLRTGRTLPFLVGRLLRDTTRAEPVLVDATGQEVKDDRPAFVISTEGEATDGHILRQYWDLNRANTVGVPALWNHNPDCLLGRWEDLAVVSLETGRALVGRLRFDTHDPVAQLRKAQVKDGILSAVSVGWRSGALVRRGELDPGDPYYREPIDGICGPEEGYLIGSEAEPNMLMEASPTPLPADPRAMVAERQWAAAGREAQAIQRGEPGSIDALLALFAKDARVLAFIDARIREAQRASEKSQVVPTLEKLFPGGSHAG